MQLEELISALDAATLSETSDEAVVKKVEEALIAAASGGMQLPDICCQALPERYARHLIHVGPDERYTIIAMVWGPEQGTPVHDHANIWCVECVLQGKIKVTNYRHMGSTDEGLEKMIKENEVVAGFGEAGHLIPPLEYHTIHNTLPGQASITLHVYGGAYNECAVFELVEKDLYQRKLKKMSIDQSLCDIPESCQ